MTIELDVSPAEPGWLIVQHPLLGHARDLTALESECREALGIAATDCLCYNDGNEAWRIAREMYLRDKTLILSVTSNLTRDEWERA